MKVLYIAAECKPFSKVGGVGDVAGELPIALQKKGIDIEIVIPLYRKEKEDISFKALKKYRFLFHGKDEIIQLYKSDSKNFPVPVNFVSNSTYFEGKYGEPYIFSEKIPFYDDILRFSFFSEACLQLIKDKQPDIVHVNDWGLGYLFGRMAMTGLPQKRVLTIHNIGYQGNIGIANIKGWQIEKILTDRRIGPLFIDPRLDWHSVNALRLALELAHRTNTVSPNYCREIAEPENPERYFEGGKGLDGISGRLREEGKLIGILNGFEYKFEPTDNEFNRVMAKKAEMKRAISLDFKNPDAFLLGFVGRAVEQKFKLLTEEIAGKSVLEHILDIPGINVAILASGHPEYETFLKILKGKKKNNCSITIAFDREKANQISLGSDVFLMPSLFEPCGITQMESLSNATPPLVRWTGGLADTVRSYTDVAGTGFGFDGSTKADVLKNLIGTVKEAVNFYTNRKDELKQLQRRGFNERFLWTTAAKEYIEKLYKPAISANNRGFFIEDNEEI